MIFRSIRIKEGMSERAIDFSRGVNLIHSGKNSCGKTTLLRFMLYVLGYNIPSTKKIKFNRCEVEVQLQCETHNEVALLRYSDDFVEATIGKSKQTFVLPAQLHELHKELFGTDNVDILNNLLGAFYVDQEKGWTLLNRGVVIGSIHFNIEELIRGLSGCDCSDLIKEETHLSHDIEKYRQMFSVAQYRETVEAESGSVAPESYSEKIDTELNQLMLRKKGLKSELSRIDRTLSDNNRFKKFVADMKLLVNGPNGVIIQVTEDNIVGLNDAIELLVAKRKLVSSELATVESKLGRVKQEQTNEAEQLEFFQSESLAEVFDKRIISIPMNPVAIKKELGKLEKRLKVVRNIISTMTRSNNSIVNALYGNVVRYATELGLGDSTTIAASYLFTSNLKELSGAVLHKTVFAFRLAYIIAIEKALKMRLPIILDSPSGKEVDQANIKLMMNILKRDFSDHQIVIASIFEYDFDNINQIEIEDKLIK